MSAQPNPLSTVYATKRRRRSNKRSAKIFWLLNLSFNFKLHKSIQSFILKIRVFIKYIEYKCNFKEKVSRIRINCKML